MQLNIAGAVTFATALCLGTWSGALPAHAAESAKTSVGVDQPGLAVAPTMQGLFFEDTNYGADGGLYAELMQNRSFEHRDALNAWTQTSRGSAQGRIAVESEAPLNANNRSFLRISISHPGGGGFGAVNPGFDGIAVREGENYQFSLYARRRAGDTAALKIQMEDADGRVLAEGQIANLGSDWQKRELQLRSFATSANARLAVLATETGVVDVDMVSLFPEKTFKGRRNGLRADLAQ